MYDFDPSVPFGVPFAPTPFRVTFTVKAGSVDVVRDLPIEYRYVKDIGIGDKKMELNVVPAFSVTVTPELAIVPMAKPGVKPTEREIFVTVTNGTKLPAAAAGAEPTRVEATVALEVAGGLEVSARDGADCVRERRRSPSARFVITAPLTAKRGDYTLKAVVTSTATGATEFSTGYQEIDYPHVQRRQVMNPARRH